MTLLSVMFVANWRSLLRVHTSSIGILHSGVCLNMIEKSHKGVIGPLDTSSHDKT